MPYRLDLAAVDDLVAEAQEDVLDRAHDLRQRVQVSARQARARERDVERLVELLELFARDALSSLALGFLQPFSQRIEGAPRLAIPPNLPQRLRQRCAAAEIRDVRLRELFTALRG